MLIIGSEGNCAITDARGTPVEDVTGTLRLTSCLDRFPTPGHFSKSLLVLGPVMQRGWIEVGAVGPQQGVDLGIYGDLAKQFLFPERAVEFSGKDRPKVDGLFDSIVEVDSKCIIRDDLEGGNAVDGMLHVTSAA